MKKIKIEITKKHPAGLEKGLVKRVVSSVAVQLIVDGYAKQVEEEGVVMIDTKQLKQNREGNPIYANKLSTLRQDVLAAISQYNNKNRATEMVEARLKNDSDNEALQGLAQDARTASDKAFKIMKKLSKKYEGLIEENSKDSIEIPEGAKVVEIPEEEIPELEGVENIALKVVQDKAQDEKGVELKQLSDVHKAALEVVISSEEIVKVAEDGLKEHAEDKELLKALEDGKVLLKESQEKASEAETALENAKKGEDKGWLAKLFGK